MSRRTGGRLSRFSFLHNICTYPYFLPLSQCLSLLAHFCYRGYFAWVTRGDNIYIASISSGCYRINTRTERVDTLAPLPHKANIIRCALFDPPTSLSTITPG